MRVRIADVADKAVYKFMCMYDMLCKRKLCTWSLWYSDVAVDVIVYLDL